jgi:hypothetical protein
LKASVTFRDGRAENKPLFFDWAICRLIGETRRGGVKKTRKSGAGGGDA